MKKQPARGILEPVAVDSAIAKFERGIRKEQDRIGAAIIKGINKQMKADGLTYADVAYTLGKRTSYVMKALERGSNMSLATLVELAHAVRLRVAVDLVKAG